MSERRAGDAESEVQPGRHKGGRPTFTASQVAKMDPMERMMLVSGPFGPGQGVVEHPFPSRLPPGYFRPPTRRSRVR